MTVPPPRQRLLLWTLAFLSTAGYGALYYAQPLLAVATEQTAGWSRAQTGLAFTLALLTNAALAPVVGRAVDRFGGKVLISGGAALGAVALGLMGLHPSYPAFVACWVLAGVAMTLTFYEPVFTVVAQQFQTADRRRATLTITLIAGLASTIFVPLTSAGLQAGGLTMALGILAGLLMITAGLGWVVLPRAARPQSRHRTAPSPFVPDPAFRQLVLSFTLARIVSVGTGLQLAPLLLARGEGLTVAAALAGLMGLAALPGRILFAPLLARLGILRLNTLLFVTLGLGPLLLASTSSVWLAGLAITLFGLANGALTLARNDLLLSRYDAGLFGTVNGRLAGPVNLAQALTPLGVGLLFSWSGTYLPSLWGLTVLAALSAWGLRAPRADPAPA
ncbi:MFS family permease [Deinococcus metalli]|uniref:MFS family permease n=1 Tax=Deinococcus metalli TaxID=1141878 RepID=A0A7W8KLG3_9DEIO|nr:MFS transporter [Deinococcus metalli]MBB5378764.1 MFS family permease [Deinococcus metalli]GHF60153.1 MFS transporter [Deinococcus metalli]